MRASFSFHTFSLALALGAGLMTFSEPSIAQDATSAAWTTFKGDASRTGSSTAEVSLPLSLQWRFSSDAQPQVNTSSPLVIGAKGQQKVIFSFGQEVFAIDLETGQQLWRTNNLQAEVITPLTLLSREDGDFLIGAQSNGKVFALETLKGAIKWETDTKTRISAATPIVLESAVGTRIIVALTNGTLVALDGAGKIVPDWKATLERTAGSTLGSLALSPDKTRIYAQTSNQKIACVDAPTGRVLWSAATNSRTSLTPIATSSSLISTSNNQVLALRSENGTLSWRYRISGNVQGSPAVIKNAGGETLYVATRSGDVIALDVNTGKVNWQKKLDFSFSGSPLALNNMILIGTTEGMMVGISPETGDKVWEYRLKTDRRVMERVRSATTDGAPPAEQATEEAWRAFPVSSAPAAIDNWVFVMGDNAALYGFTSNSIDADPPRAVGPTITVPDTAKNLASLEIGDKQQIIPGSGPIYFSVELDDIGSGLNPTTIKITLDEKPLAAKNIDFDAQSGVLTLTLVGREKGSLALEEGLKTLNILAEDFAGNKMDYTATILVDNLAAPPPAPVDPAAAPLGEPQPPVAMPGGFPGGFPGGVPNAFGAFG
jgi:outer membrane protein assembly factor BamB